MYFFYFDLVFIRCILKALNTSWRSSSILSTHFVGVEFSLPSTNECCLNSVSYLTKSKVFSVLAFLIWSLSQQATIIPKPEWSGHFGGTLKLQSPPFRVTKRRSRWKFAQVSWPTRSRFLQGLGTCCTVAFPTLRPTFWACVQFLSWDVSGT